MEGDELNNLLEDALDDLLKKREPSNATQPIQTGSQGQSSSKKSAGKSSRSQRNERTPMKEFDQLHQEKEMDEFFARLQTQLTSEFSKIESEMDPEEAREKINDTVPQIFGLMQNLLSKELLYPALNDLVPKFNEWMQKNEGKLSSGDKERFENQQKVIKDILANFDDESLETQERFEKNLELMEKMQSYGSPPDELTVPEGMQQKCSIM